MRNGLVATAAVMALATALAWMGGCGGKSRRDGQAGGKLSVFVAIPPLAYFVERVGGEHVQVGVLVQAGQDPHTFELTPKQTVALSEARIYLSVGMPFERVLVAKLASSFPDLTVVDLRNGVPLRDMTADEMEAEERDHAHEGPHGQETLDDEDRKDPHIWMDPKLARIEARTICDSLSQADPSHAADYAANLKVFQGDLDAVDVRIAKALAPLKGRDFFVYHPAFGYFAASYGLRQKAVEAGGREPGSKQIDDLVALARKQGAKVIFVQPQFSAPTADTIAHEIGGAVVRMDDLAPDYLKNLETVAAEIERALGRKTPSTTPTTAPNTTTMGSGQ